MKIKEQIKNEISKLQSSWEKLSQRDKIIVAILILVVPCVLYYKFVYTPKVDELQKLEKKKEQLTQKLSSLKAKKIRLKKLEQEEKQVKIVLAQAQKFLPEKREISDLLNNIAKEGKKFDLTITKFQAQDEIVTENSIYATIPLELEVEGSFHNIMLFLDNLRFQQRILIPERLLAKEGKEGLKATCKINTYRFLTKEELEKIEQAKNKKSKKKNKRKKKKKK